MRVKPKERWHLRELVLLEYTAEAEWPEEAAEKLILIHDPVTLAGVSEPRALSTNRPMTNVWPVSREKG